MRNQVDRSLYTDRFLRVGGHTIDRFGSVVACVLAILLLVVPLAVQAHQCVGVIDTTGRTIIPCQYKEVTYLGNGFMLLQEFDPNDVWNHWTAHLVTDHDGNPIPIRIPEGSMLDGVHFPGNRKRADSASLPPDTILRVHTKDGCGLCTLGGEILVAPGPLQILEHGEAIFSFQKADAEGRVSYYFFNGRNRITTRLSFQSGSQVQFGNRFRSGLIPFFTYPSDGRSPGRSIGLIDNDGNILMQSPHERLSEFSDDLTKAIDFSSGRRTLTLINRKGETVSAEFDQLTRLENGVAVAKQGNKFGFVNEKLEFVSRTDYRQMLCLLPDMYAVEEPGSDRFIAIDHAGKVLFKFPPEVIEVEDQLVEDPQDGMILCKLKQQRVDVLEKDLPLFGFVSPSGKLVCRVNAESVLPYCDGYGLVFGSKNGSLLDKKGSWVLPAEKDVQLTPLGPDRLAEYTKDEGFSPIDWKDKAKGDHGSRIDQFRTFLREYNLIGMSRKELTDLLGAGSLDGPFTEYSFLGSHCAEGNQGMEIQFEADKVARWRFVYFMRTGPWVTTNVVLTYTTPAVDTKGLTAK